MRWIDDDSCLHDLGLSVAYNEIESKNFICEEATYFISQVKRSLQRPARPPRWTIERGF
jgi:hypothetical protein